MTDDGPKNTADIQEPVNRNTILDDETIHSKWQDLAGLYKQKPRLANAISSATLEISGEGQEKRVTFKVFNTAQRDWIAEKCLRELEGNFQRLTGSSVRLEVAVIEDHEVEKVPYMPSEKAAVLIEGNEEVKTLVQDLGLDIR